MYSNLSLQNSLHALHPQACSSRYQDLEEREHTAHSELDITDIRGSVSVFDDTLGLFGLPDRCRRHQPAREHAQLKSSHMRDSEILKFNYHG